MKSDGRRVDTCLVAGAFLLFGVLLASAASAQQWVQLYPTGSPPTPRYTAGNAYDAVNDRLILFSGEDDLSGSTPPRTNNDVWVLTNASGAAGSPSWQLLLSVTPRPDGAYPDSLAVPLARFGGSVSYDPAGNRILVHGGCWWNCGFGLSDAWVLDHANGLGGIPAWHRLADAPIGRASHTSVYDPGSGRLIVFGGDTASFGSMRNDVWVLDVAANTWTELHPSGQLPPPRNSHTAVYDRAENRMIVFGGGVFYAGSTTIYDDVWVLTHANGLDGDPEWIPLAPAGPAPGARASHSAVFDPTSGRMIVFGGVLDRRPDSPIFYNDVWALANASGVDGVPEWAQLEPSGDSPPTLTSASIGYAPDSDRMVVAMGRHDAPTYQLFNDVWVLRDTRGIRTVHIDIKPGTLPNDINLGSKGLVPVAVLSDSSFDATGVDPATVYLAGAPVMPRINGSLHADVCDVNGDGRLDLVVQLATAALKLTKADTSATLEGKTYDGMWIRGTDSVRIVP